MTALAAAPALTDIAGYFAAILILSLMVGVIASLIAGRVGVMVACFMAAIVVLTITRILEIP